MEFLTDPVQQLFPVSHGHEKPVADTTVEDGKFIFKGWRMNLSVMVEHRIRFTASDVENRSISVEGKGRLLKTLMNREL